MQGHWVVQLRALPIAHIAGLCILLIGPRQESRVNITPHRHRGSHKNSNLSHKARTDMPATVEAGGSKACETDMAAWPAFSAYLF